MSGRRSPSARTLLAVSLWMVTALVAACVALPASTKTDRVSLLSPSPSIEPRDVHTAIFAIHIFEPGSLGTLGYSVASSWPLLQQADLSTSAFVITEDDIVSYDWTHQQLMLTSQLRKKYEVESMTFLADFSPFVVTIDQQPVFGGMILKQFSPLAIDFPVLYVLNGPAHPDEDLLSIALRPTHDYQRKLDAPSSFPSSDSQLADSVRQHFVEIGKLAR